MLEHTLLHEDISGNGRHIVVRGRGVNKKATKWVCLVVLGFFDEFPDLLAIDLDQSNRQFIMAAQGILKQGFLVKKVSEKRRMRACRPFYRVVARCYILYATGLPKLWLRVRL